MEAAFPAFAELAPAPKVATLVEAVVLEVSDPLQPVPGAATVQVYVKASPAEGGVSTEGPLAGLKSEVTFKVSVPVPVDCVVRILYVRLVVPVYGLDYKDKPDDGRAWLAQNGDPYTASMVDRDGRVGIDYGVYGVPETFVIDKAGIVRYKQIGPLTVEALQQKILPLVAELKK